MFFSCSSGKIEGPLNAEQKYQKTLDYDSMNSKQEKYASLKDAIQLAQTETNYHLTLGAAYFSDGDLKSAEKEFLQILKLDKKYNKTHQNLGPQ